MQEMISKIEALLAPLLEGTDMFVTNLQIEPGNNIKLFLDADEGLNVQKSVSINRQLVAQIDELGWYPNGDYSLEVSSPGVDEPLRSQRCGKRDRARQRIARNARNARVLGLGRARP